MAIRWIKDDGGHKAGDIAFVGSTLTGSLEQYDGSDRYTDYAEAWDGSKIIRVPLGYGYCTMTTTVAEAVPDAKDDVIRLVAEWRKKAAWEAGYHLALVEAKKPCRGKMLMVVKGRKVPRETIGYCFWDGAGRFGRRVGIKDSKGQTHWTAAVNVIVIDPQKYLPDAYRQD